MVYLSFNLKKKKKLSEEKLITKRRQVFKTRSSKKNFGAYSRKFVYTRG